VTFFPGEGATKNTPFAALLEAARVELLSSTSFLKFLLSSRNLPQKDLARCDKPFHVPNSEQSFGVV